ncbi:MAG TPA: hypothetical protein VJM78_06195, partial [Rhizomicrobium sp.]|nr:hypothetical protein [Rhizomicrobium sp.]
VDAEGPKAVFDEIDVGGLGDEPQQRHGFGLLAKTRRTYRLDRPQTSSLWLAERPVSAGVGLLPDQIQWKIKGVSVTPAKK